MRIRDKKRILVGAGGLIGVLAVGSVYAFIFHAYPFHTPVAASSPAASFEGRLQIPSLKVDVSIDSVGLTPKGAMEAPSGPQGVAWFSLGTRPGDVGTAVIAGHRGWKNGIPAVFDNLDKLRAGDKIVIVDAHGKTTTFAVRETRLYDKYAAPPEVFTSASGTHLNLITCVGEWNAAIKSTSERLVVFADLVS